MKNGTITKQPQARAISSYASRMFYVNLTVHPGRACLKSDEPFKGIT